MPIFKSLVALTLSLISLTAIPSCALLEDDETPDTTPVAARPRAYKVDPIRNKTVTVRIHTTFTYTPKDESSVRAHLPEILLARLNTEGRVDSNKFEFAEGVKPNMIINVTVNNDHDNHYTATARVALYQDDQFFTVTSGSEPYNTPELMINALISNLYGFLHNGFHRD